jgi:hypothetical protein
VIKAKARSRPSSPPSLRTYRAVPFDLRVAAAHWRIVLDQAEALRSFGSSTWLAARFARTSYLVHGLPERYALVVVFARAAGLAGWHRAIAVCIRALSEEAKWRRSGPSDRPWFSVDVTSDRELRPKSVEVAGCVRRVEILGTVVNDGLVAGSVGPGELAPRERGWRVRFESGAEATLVREPGGAWYVDAAIEGAGAGRRPKKNHPQSR